HRKAEGGKIVGLLADGDRAILEPFEEGALRLQGDAVDLVEKDDFGRGHRAELGDELPGGRVEHLEPYYRGGLEVGAALDAREAGVADRGEDDPEKRVADARHTAVQQVAGVHLP